MYGGFDYVAELGSADFAVALGFIIGAYAVAIALSVFVLVCWVKVFKKFGVKGWYALCPVYNDYLLAKHVWGDGWVFLLMWIPFFNIYLYCKTQIGLAKSFGKSAWFGVGLILLGIIFLPILAFGKSQYSKNPYSM